MELAHVELAGGHFGIRTVRLAVDMQRTHATDTLTAVVVERHRFFALVYQVVVQDIEHFEERRVFGDIVHLVRLEPAFCLGVRLTPYLKFEIHRPLFLPVSPCNYAVPP